MGGGLRKPAPSYTVKRAFTASVPSGSATVVPGASGKDAQLALDAQLDREEELQAQEDEERAQKQKAAVSHVVENLFPYAPVAVKAEKYPVGSAKAGQAYLWIVVDEDAIKRRGAAPNSPIRYPIGVAVDGDGNVFVSESSSTPGSPNGAKGEVQLTQTISVESILGFAGSKQVPPTPKSPKLVEATQTSLELGWKKSTDTTADRYELQYRRADSPNGMWASLAVVSSVKNVTLDSISCHTAYTFRMRCHNPAGWSEFSCASDAFWSLPGAPETPHPPVAGAVTNSYASIFWSKADDRGAAPVVYFLEMRESSTTTMFQQIYEGTECSFLATGLKPKSTYLFRLQASNVVGSTAFVESRPVRTLAHGRPEIVELTSSEQSSSYDRWVQCWDPKSEQVFFFNKYTCQRVIEEPRELAKARERFGLSNVEETPEMVFRRKRFRFHRDLRQHHMQGTTNFGSTVTLQLTRANMLEDTFAHFQRFSKQELVSKPKITFENEPGIDSGGLTKDWFLQISKLVLDKKRNLFKQCDRGQFEIDSNSSRNSRHLQYFKFLGKFIAKAIFDRQTVDLPFCDAIYKYLLHLPTHMDDLHQMDAQFHKSLVWILENSVSDVIDETFSVEVEGGGSSLKKPMVVDLKENGRDIPVTDLNKEEYVELVVQWRTEFGVKAQLDALVQGLNTLIPASAIKVFDLSELRMLMNGKPTIDVEELRASTVFQGGYSEHSQVVLWLWQALREFSLEMRGLFLKFMTGTNKIPLDGFEPPLNLTKSDLDPQALPRTHTCFNQLVLPEYTSYATLIEKVTFAIQNAEGFELS